MSKEQKRSHDGFDHGIVKSRHEEGTICEIKVLLKQCQHMMEGEGKEKNRNKKLKFLSCLMDRDYLKHADCRSFN